MALMIDAFKCTASVQKLLMSAKLGCTEVVRVLLERGASDPSEKLLFDGNKKSALELYPYIRPIVDQVRAERERRRQREQGQALLVRAQVAAGHIVNNLENMTLEQLKELKDLIKQEIKRRKEQMKHQQQQRAGATAASNDDESSSLCVICMEEPRSVLIMPCNHLITCQNCIARLPRRECPVCRGNILQTVRVIV